MWGIISSNGSIVAATHAGQLIVPLQGKLETDLGASLNQATASAIRVNVNYRLTASTTGDDCTVACGVMWATDAAVAVGGTSIPDPHEDHADWMFHDIRTLSSSRDVTDVDEQVLGSFMQIRNDSMRKQRENNSQLIMVFRCSILQPTSLQVFIGGRVLYLNP